MSITAAIQFTQVLCRQNVMFSECIEVCLQLSRPDLHQAKKKNTIKMQNANDRKRQCEMKTDLNLLLECLKYQMDHPASQKEALVTIYSVCQQNSDASDYFQEIGGLMFVHNLAKSSVHSMVKEGALFTLGGLAENNVFCQQVLCTSGLFDDLRMFLTNKDSSLNLKRMSVYVVLVLVSNNKSGQTCVRESGCLDVLLQLFRTSHSVSKVDLLDQNVNQYHLWSSICSALCACVNNPQNEDNQKICSLVFPHAKGWLQSCMKPEIVRPICSFIGLTVANNSSMQQFFVSVGGLAVLDELLVKLLHNSFGNYSSTKLAVVVTKTLDACIADNPAVGVSLPRYNIVPNLLTLLSYNILDSGERFSIILTLGHCTEGCEENQCTLIKNNGLPVMIQALTELQDDDLHKAATFVLQNCKHIIEKLSLKLRDQSLKVDDASQLEVDQQSKEMILEDYWDKAKDILYRIKRLENDHQEEKVRRQILDEDIPQYEILQTTAKHPKVNARKQIPNNGMTSTKAKQPLLNSITDKLIATKFVNVSSKTERLKPANRNPIDASISQNDYNNSLHSADKMRTAHKDEVHIINKSIFCGSNNSDVEPSEFLYKQPNFVVNSTTQEVQNTELLCSSRGIHHILATYIDPKLSELRCSGCKTMGLPLNSRNFSKMLQSCQYLCEQHKVILETEMKYKRKLKKSIISSRNTFPDYNDTLLSSTPAFRGGQNKEAPDLRRVTNARGRLQNILTPLKKTKNSNLNTIVNMNRNNKLLVKDSIKPTYAKTYLPTKCDGYSKKHSVKDPDLSENHIYSFEDEQNTEIPLSEIPSTALKTSKRRTRKDFTSEEIKYLLAGVKKMGHHWNSILWAYPFQKGRTNVDLAKKYCNLQKNEKNKNMTLKKSDFSYEQD